MSVDFSLYRRCEVNVEEILANNSKMNIKNVAIYVIEPNCPHLHSSNAVVDTWPINFMIRYGVANIRAKNVRIGQADTFLPVPSEPAAFCAPLVAADANISLNRASDGSTLVRPAKYSNLSVNENEN